VSRYDRSFIAICIAASIVTTVGLWAEGKTISAALISGLVVGFVIGPIYWLWTRLGRVRRHPTRKHNIAVYDTRPRAGDKHQFDPYYVAVCSCGWIGNPSKDVEEANHDARVHVPGVNPPLHRPVG
jgi:hypothetical protein